MIAKITGKVIEHDGRQIIVDCSGVGYGVIVSVDESSRCVSGAEVSLYILENIKEDSHDLYGFFDKSKRDLCSLLMTVSGVGPRAAMSILDLGSEGALRTAISSGDIKYLTAASGVGKKVAERVVVDLKNKVGSVSSDGATDFLRGPAISAADEAFQALVALGYSSEDAARALEKVDASLPTDERLKVALRNRF
jgi:holliday junction DNA helicase RuvA